MKLYFVLIALIILLIIQSSYSRVSKSRQTLPVQKPVARAKSQANGAKVVKSVGSAVGSVVGFGSKKVKQVVILIKCVIKCLIQNTLNLKICNQMFPCLYDCFIGQEYIPPDVQLEIDKAERGKASWPKAITLDGIYSLLKCIYSCGTERPVRNWETFVYMLYCFADSCVCFQMFDA